MCPDVQRTSSRHGVAKTVEPEIANCPLPNPPVLIPRHYPLPRRRSEDSACEQLSVAVFMETPWFNILAMAPALPFSNRTVSTKRSGRKEQGAVDRNTSYPQDLVNLDASGSPDPYIMSLDLATARHP
jgi:hypothetical protein